MLFLFLYLLFFNHRYNLDLPDDKKSKETSKYKVVKLVAEQSKF